MFNLQQRFGAISIHLGILVYISNFLAFIADAKSYLRPELSNIISPSDFVSSIFKPEIDVFRLQPKSFEA